MNLILPQNSNIIRPQQGGQWEYFQRPEFEVLFGGAAGPGKSWALVIDALGLQYQHTKLGKAAIECPEYRAVLFMRKTTQLSKLIDEAKKYYCNAPFNAEFIAQRKGDPGVSFNFPSGARIFMCHLEQEDDKENHQGIEYQFVGFDELTQFTITQYLYLFSRLRSAVPYLTCRIRSTTNPTGSGLIWVRKRFIKNATKTFAPKKTYYFVQDPELEPAENPTGIEVAKGTANGKSRTFIPGKLDENKMLQDVEGYRSNISAMGKKMQKALLEGNWDAFGGDFFDDFDSETMAIEPFKIPLEWKLIGAIDPGWSSPCSFSLKAKDFEGNVYRLFTYYVRNQNPQQHAQDIKNKILNFPYTQRRMPEYIVSGRDAFAKKDQHAIMASSLTFSDVFRDAGLYLMPAVTDRVLGWWVTKELHRMGKFKYFKGFNDPFVEEIVAAEHDGNDIEDIKGRGNSPEVSDHSLDEDRYGNMSLIDPVELKRDTRPEWLKEMMEKAKRKDSDFMGT